MFTMTQIQLSGVRMAGYPKFSLCTPLLRGCVLCADPDERRPDDGAAEVLSAEVLRTIDAKKITVAMPSMLYASMDPSQLGHARPVDDRGRLTSSCVSGRRFKSHRLPWLRPIGPLLR